MNKIIRNVKTKERFIEIAKTIPNPGHLILETKSNGTYDFKIYNINGIVEYVFNLNLNHMKKGLKALEIGLIFKNISKEIFND